MTTRGLEAAAILLFWVALPVGFQLAAAILRTRFGWDMGDLTGERWFWHGKAGSMIMAVLALWRKGVREPSSDA